MRKVVAFLQRLWKALTGDPIVLAMIVAFIFFTSFAFLELFRAELYESSVDDFRRSSQVQNMLSVADAMSINAERDELSIQCDLRTDTVFVKSPDEKNTESIAYVHAEANRLLSAKPSFSSPAVFLDGVQTSRDLHRDVQDSLSKIASLTSDNIKAHYCEQLSNALGDAFFLRELETSAGVNSLLVGQIENYWVNLDSTIDRFSSIERVPVEFADQHAAVSNSLFRLAAAIRNDTRDVKGFSQGVEEEMDKIREVFLQLKEKSPELNDLIARMQLASAGLRFQGAAEEHYSR